MFKMLISVLLIPLFAVSLAQAEPSCRSLLVVPDQAHSYYFSKISNSLRWLETDRKVAYEKYSDRSVYDYIKYILRIQEMQIRAMSTDYPQTLEPKIVEHYRQILSSSLQSNRKNFEDLAEKHPLEKIKVASLLEENAELSDPILTMMIRVSSFLAEFLAVVQFPNVLRTETEVGKIVGDNFPKDEDAQKLLESVAVRQMDFVSQEGEHTVWAEVKYLGRYKEYAHATGHEVLDKMIRSKQVTDLLPSPHRVLLIIVGPGRLAQEAYDAYIQNGVEVIYLTPEWTEPASSQLKSA